MTKSSEGYWDELGVAWCAIDPDVGVVASRLETRLRRQSRWITAGRVIGLPLGAAGALLGVATMGAGLSSGAWNFVTRGSAIAATSAILTFALWSLQSVSAVGGSSTLSQMLELAIGRAQRTLSLIRAGLYSCVIAAVLGLVGTAIRIQLDRPPRTSPIVDLAILALIALVLFLCGRQLRVELGKYRALRQALAVDEDVSEEDD
jgi:hypothetical protein